MTAQPEALRLAEVSPYLEGRERGQWIMDAAAELRRLHEVEVAYGVMMGQADDPAIHFCHRFAILMECLLLTKDINGYWDEVNNLLSEYNSARDAWMTAHGQPYVSGFGKD